MTYVYDPRDYSAPGILYVPTSDDTRDEPPIPGDDDWQGPEDADECRHRFPNKRCQYCGILE